MHLKWSMIGILSEILINLEAITRQIDRHLEDRKTPWPQQRQCSLKYGNDQRGRIVLQDKPVEPQIVGCRHAKIRRGRAFEVDIGSAPFTQCTARYGKVRGRDVGGNHMVELFAEMARDASQTATKFKYHRKLLGPSAHPRQCGKQHPQITGTTVVKGLLPFGRVFRDEFRASQHRPIRAFLTELPPSL